MLAVATVRTVPPVAAFDLVLLHQALRWRSSLTETSCTKQQLSGMILFWYLILFKPKLLVFLYWFQSTSTDRMAYAEIECRT
jgi:hypothetical protein